MTDEQVSPAHVSATIDRKFVPLIGALVLLVGICLLPEPAPLERAGLSIPLTTGGRPASRSWLSP